MIVDRLKGEGRKSCAIPAGLKGLEEAGSAATLIDLWGAGKGLESTDDMNGNLPTDELLNQAFRLAHFILGDRTSSIYVAMAALDKLKTASAIQDRRLYYTPAGRFNYP